MVHLKKHSFVAGMLIGLGVIINTMSSDRVIGAALFSLGLLAIIHLQLPLYTGQIGFISERRKMDLFRILIFNFLGIIFLVGLKTIFDSSFQKIFLENAEIKFTKPVSQMLVEGFICGILIHLAVKCKNKIITVAAVMLFILSGAEHCIADYPYLCMGFSMMNLVKFLVVILGNSLGAIFLEKLI